MKKTDTYRLVLAGLFMALAFILPTLTGQAINRVWLPMHIPVLLCGFVCGWKYGLAVGALAPLLRGAIFGMPPLMPTGLAMAFELAAYGALAGLLYEKLPKKAINVYVSLILAMLAGRVVWGLVSVLIYMIQGAKTFTFAMFLSGAFVNAVTGIMFQIVVIPLILFALERAKLFPIKKRENGKAFA